MAIQARLFDGTTLEFPDGTDPSVIDRVAAEETAARNKQVSQVPQAQSKQPPTPTAKPADIPVPTKPVDTGFTYKSLEEMGYRTKPEQPTLSTAPPSTIEQRDAALAEALNLRQMQEDYAYKPEGGVLEQLGTGIKRTATKSALALEQGAGGTITFLGDMIGADTSKPTTVLNKLNKKMEAIGDPESRPARLVEGAVTSIAQQIPALGLGILTGSEALVLGDMFVNSFGQTYDNSRRAGLDVEDSTKRSSIFAAAEVLGEKFGLGALMREAKTLTKGVSTAELSKALTKYILAQVPGEELTYATQYATDRAFDQNQLGVLATKEQEIENFLEGAADTFYATMLQGGIMMGGGHALNKAIKEIKKDDPSLSAEEARTRALNRWKKEGIQPSKTVPPPAVATEQIATEQVEPDLSEKVIAEKAKPIENVIYQDKLNKLIEAGTENQNGPIISGTGGESADISGKSDIAELVARARGADRSGVAGAGSDVGTAASGANAQPAALSATEQPIVDAATQAGVQFNAPSHARNWVKKNVLNGDEAAAAQLEKDNPGIYRRLFDTSKQTTAAPVVKTETIEAVKETPAFNETETKEAEELATAETVNVKEVKRSGPPKAFDLKASMDAQQAEAEALADKLLPSEEVSEEAAVETAPKAEEVLNEEEVAAEAAPVDKKELAKNKLADALARAGNKASKVGRTNIVPEEDEDWSPILRDLFSATADMGITKIEDAIEFVKTQLRELGIDVGIFKPEQFNEAFSQGTAGLRSQAKQKQEAELENKQIAFAANEPARAKILDQKETERVERAYPVKSLSAADIGEEELAGYDANRAVQNELLGEKLEDEADLTEDDLLTKEIPAWNELSEGEKTVYSAVNKTKGPDEAIKALYAYRTNKEGKSNKDTAPKNHNAAIYELNKNIASKEHQIEFPSWQQLSEASQNLFLENLPELTGGMKTKRPTHSGVAVDSAFQKVAEQLEKENVGFRGKKQIDIENAELASQSQQAQAEYQAQEDKARAASNQAVGKGTKLSLSAIDALENDGINGVLNYLADSSQGLNVIQTQLTIEGKAKPIKENNAFKYMRGIHKLASEKIFKALAKTLKTVNFTSTVITDPNDLAIVALRREGKLAEYDPKTDTFYFTPEGLDESTILHEVIHAATVKIINQFKTNPASLTQSQRDAVQHLEKLFTFVSNRLGNKYPNAVENIYEFVAYAMTDFKFQAELAKLQVPRLGRYTLTTEDGVNLGNLVKTVWGQFTTALMEMHKLLSPKPIKLELRPDIFSNVAKDFATVKGSLDELYQELDDENLDTDKAALKKAELSEYDESEDTTKGPTEFAPAARLLSMQKGFESNVLLEVAEVMNRILAAPEVGTQVEPLAAKAPKQAPKQAPKGPRTWEDMKKSAKIKTQESVSRLKRIALGFAHPKQSYEYLVPRIQNSAAGLKLWENRLQATGEIESDPNKVFTNAYELISLAAAESKALYGEYITPHETIMNDKLRELMEATKSSLVDVLEDAGLYMTGLHEPERRRLMFILNIPLRNDFNITINGVTGSPADFRDYILNALENLQDTQSSTTTQQAQYLRNVLDAIVFTNPGDLTSPNKDIRKGTLNNANIDTTRKIDHPEEFDENSSKYSVVGQFSPEEIDTLLDKLNNDTNKDLYLELNKAVHNMELATIELNKIGNYWSPPVANRVAFYGFKNYIPFKGRPDLAEKRNDGLFTSTDDLRSKDFQFYQGPMQGRTSEADNPIIQVVVDAEKAAFIATHNNVTQAVVNAIKKGLIEGKLEKKILFSERFTGLTKEEIANKNTIFNYLPNGTIEIYSVSEKPILDSLRRPYVEHHDVTQALYDMSGFVNRFMGQGFTRFNPGFAPYNMVRDTITNLLNVFIDKGPVVITKMTGLTIYNTLLDTIMGGGMISAARDMDLYKQGKIGALKNKAKKDQYTKDFLDNAMRGGIVSYLMTVSNASKIRQMSQNIENKNWAAVKRGLTIAFDHWFDAFENIVKTSGYSVLVKHYKSKGLSQEAAEIKAAAYNKNLANFEQSGKYGSEMASLYMFSRPQATGAVRAIDSLKFGFVSMKEEAKKLPKKVQDDPVAMAAFKKDYEAKAFRARTLVVTMVGFGMFMYLMTFLTSDKDEQGNNIVAKDDKSRMTRAMRFPIPGTEYVFQLPNGFGLGAFTAWGQQIAAFGMGHQTFAEFMSNVSTIGLDSFMPVPVSRMPFFESPMGFAKAIFDTIWPSSSRPVFEWMINTNGLGQEIVHDTRGKSEAYSGSMSVPEKYREFSNYMLKEYDVDISPNLVYFFANNYVNGISLLGQNLDNIAGLMGGDKEFSAKTDTVVLNSFISTRSDYYSKEFNRVEKEILDMKGRIDTADKKGYYNEYVAKHPFEQTVVEVYDKDVGGELKDLRAARADIINSKILTRIQRDQALKVNKAQQQAAKARMVGAYKFYLPKLKTRQDKD